MYKCAVSDRVSHRRKNHPNPAKRRFFVPVSIWRTEYEVSVRHLWLIWHKLPNMETEKAIDSACQESAKTGSDFPYQFRTNKKTANKGGLNHWKQRKTWCARLNSNQ